MVEVMNRQALIMLKHASEMGFTPVGRSSDGGCTSEKSVVPPLRRIRGGLGIG